VRRGLVKDFSRGALLKTIQSSSLEVSISYDVLGNADIVFVAVNTPTKPDGSQDLSQVLSALNSLAEVWKSLRFNYRIMVLKSTVLPRTTRALARYARDELGLPIPDRVGFAYSPELLKADKALEDVFKPSRVVIRGINAYSYIRIATFFREFYNQKPRPSG